MIKLLVFLSSFLLVCQSAKYPSNLPKCLHGDTTCITNAFNEIIGQGQNGITDINLIPLDPLHVDFINIIQGQNQNSPVNLALKLIDINVIGLDRVRAIKVVGFEKDPTTSKLEIHGEIPRLEISGNYKMKGQILVLPIQGHGLCNITIDNSKSSIKSTLKLVQAKGRDYAQVDKLFFSINPKKVFVNFDNLFNGDKAIGDSMNLFLNENWETIFTEMKPIIDDAVGEIVKNIINNVFAKIPYKDLFVD